MATAMKDAYLQEAEKSANYERPPITIGDDVLYYEHHNLQRTPILSKVAFVGPRVIEAVTCNGGVNRKLDGVRHISDPDLELKPQLKKLGSWDFTDAYKERIAIRNAMTERFENIEKRIAALERKPYKDSHKE